MTTTRCASLLLITLATATVAQADPTTRAFNEEVQGVWDKLRPSAEQELKRQAHLKIGAITREPKVEVDLLSIKSIDLDVRRAPGLTSFDQSGLRARVPAEGTWTVTVEAEVEVRFRALWRWNKLKRTVRVEVSDISVSADAAFDWSDPTRPKVSRIGKPEVFFRVRVRTPGNILTDVLVRALSPLGSVLARHAVGKALDALTPQLDALKAKLPGAVPAESAPLMTDSGSTVPVGAIVAAVDQKIRAHHLPHGIIHPMRMDVPATDTWAQAFGPNGGGNPGVYEPHGDGGDSATWNGHFMAAQAWRHAITRDPEALDNVKRCLVAFDDMLVINGDKGLMARCAAPESSPMGQIILRSNSPASVKRAMRRGEMWVATNGDKGDSRDVYIEIVYGLAVVHDMIADPQVRAQADRILTEMVAYLVRVDWVIDEDRAPVNFASPTTSTLPTFWLGVPTQKVTMLLTAARIDPARFGGELARWAPLTKMAWLSQWTGTFSLDDYFGFTLSHVTYYTHLRHETDIGRWREMNRAYRVMRRFVGNHKNAYFDAIHVAIDPADAAFKGAVREELARYVTRPHRKVAPATFDLAAIKMVPWTFPFGGYMPGTTNATTLMIASEPILPEQHAPEDDMIWQRNPFTSIYKGPGQGDAYIESTGLDLTAPYWLARYHGVSFP